MPGKRFVLPKELFFLFCLSNTIYLDADCATAYASGGCARTNGGLAVPTSDATDVTVFNGSGENWDIEDCATEFTCGGANAWGMVDGSVAPFLQ